jgi:hypothetical protein
VHSYSNDHRQKDTADHATYQSWVTTCNKYDKTICSDDPMCHVGSPVLINQPSLAHTNERHTLQLRLDMLQGSGLISRVVSRCGSRDRVVPESDTQPTRVTANSVSDRSFLGKLYDFSQTFLIKITGRSGLCVHQDVRQVRDKDYMRHAPIYMVRT